MKATKIKPTRGYGGSAKKLAAYLDDGARCIMLDTPCDYENALKIAAKRYEFDMRVIRGDNQPVQVKEKKWRSPTEKAHKTKGLIVGRSTLKQQEYLEDLGVPRSTSVQWTMHRASKEISLRVERKRSDSARRGAPSATLSTPAMGASRPNTGTTHGRGSPALRTERRLGLANCAGDGAHAPQVNTMTEKAAVSGNTPAVPR